MNTDRIVAELQSMQPPITGIHLADEHPIVATDQITRNK
jgi:hypothetical protein